MKYWYIIVSLASFLLAIHTIVVKELDLFSRLTFFKHIKVYGPQAVSVGILFLCISIYFVYKIFNDIRNKKK